MIEEQNIAETVDLLRREVTRLKQRIAALENGSVEIAAEPAPVEIKPTPPEPLSEEVLLALSAAIAAYLGVEPHIRQIRLLHSHPWGQQGRVTIQASHRISVKHDRSWQ